MEESTLSLERAALEKEAALFLGFGRGTNFDDTAWTTRQQADITECVQSGLRAFYFPSPMPGDMASYSWSFMTPTRQIVLSSGSDSAPLPDDFAGLEGKPRLVDSGRIITEISVTNEDALLRWHTGAPDRTGSPLWCAIRTSPATSLYKGSRSSLYLFPTADEEYTLEIKYYFSPDSLSVSFPYPHGGAVHAETIKAACLAKAELYKDNQTGPMAANFMDRMRASVSLDRRNKAQSFGMMSDPGYNRARSGYGFWHNDRVNVTVGGVNPDSI